MENTSNKNHNVTSHQINKIEAQKDIIINDYSEQLRNANRLKKKTCIRSRKNRNYRKRSPKTLE